MADVESAGAAAEQPQKKQATVTYGVYGAPGPHAGKTIADVRKQLAPQWGIPGDARAYKGKNVMDENYVIQPDDKIDFHRTQGEKGI